MTREIILTSPEIAKLIVKCVHFEKDTKIVYLSLKDAKSNKNRAKKRLYKVIEYAKQQIQELDKN